MQSIKVPLLLSFLCVFFFAQCLANVYPPNILRGDPLSANGLPQSFHTRDSKSETDYINLMRRRLDSVRASSLSRNAFPKEIDDIQNAIVARLTESTSPAKLQEIVNSANNLKARSSMPHSCPPEMLVYLANLYLLSQVTAYAPANNSRWNAFISQLASNISFTSNVASGATTGIQNVTQLLFGIGTQYQNISRIIEFPTNFIQTQDTGSNNFNLYTNPTGDAVVATFIKQQRELSSGVFMNLQFYHKITAIPVNDNRVCVVTNVDEYANFGNTIKSLPTLSGQDPVAWICQMFSILCHGYVPSFGSTIDNAPGVNDAGKCYYFWKSAPSLVQLYN